MKTRKVNRYYCDFCKKAGCSSGHLKRHEKHCTMNPNRECRMCGLARHKQTPMVKLLNILPDPTQYTNMGMLNEQTKVQLIHLKKLSSDCPVCIFSALRQRGLVGYLEFNLQEEMKLALNKINQQDIV